MNAYRKASIAYAIPFVFLILFVIDIYTFDFSKMLFFVLFLLALLPCSVVGFIFAISGFNKSRELHHNLHSDAGKSLIYGGVVLFIAGLLTLSICAALMW